MTEVTPNQLRPWRDWRRKEGGPRFPTDESFMWFARQHKRELVESGEYFPAMGPPGTLVGPKIGRVVVEILQRKARREAA